MHNLGLEIAQSCFDLLQLTAGWPAAWPTAGQLFDLLAQLRQRFASAKEST